MFNTKTFYADDVRQIAKSLQVKQDDQERDFAQALDVTQGDYEARLKQLKKLASIYEIEDPKATRVLELEARLEMARSPIPGEARRLVGGSEYDSRKALAKELSECQSRLRSRKENLVAIAEVEASLRAIEQLRAGSLGKLSLGDLEAIHSLLSNVQYDWRGRQHEKPFFGRAATEAIKQRDLAKGEIKRRRYEKTFPEAKQAFEHYERAKGAFEDALAQLGDQAAELMELETRARRLLQQCEMNKPPGLTYVPISFRTVQGSNLFRDAALSLRIAGKLPPGVTG